MTQKFRILPFAALALVATGCSLPRNASASSTGRCPDEAAGETVEDCPWAAWARELEVEAGDTEGLARKFRERARIIAVQIEADSRRTAWKDLWGRSINYDEYAKGTIVRPALIETLSSIFGTSVEDRLVHAGLEHTYGYLFSTLKTPFGYKRARWVRGEIETGLDLPKGLLGPSPAGGTLFSNATYFFGRIAFRGEANPLGALDRHKSAVPKPLRDYDYESLPVTRLEETIRGVVKGMPRTVVLRTDLIPFKKVPAGPGNTFLLIYSVKDSRKGSQLITAFPVEKGFVDRVSDSAGLGDDKPIVTRYNAHVDGITGQSHRGSRVLLGATR